MATGADTLRVLEWDKVRHQLACLSHTPEGRAQLEQLSPLESYEDQLTALRFAGECLELLQRGDTLPMRPLTDLEPILIKSAPAGALMEGTELALAGDFCQLCTQLSSFEKTLPEQSALLKAALREISAAPDFAKAVGRALEPDGSVRDSASPTLLKLRRTRQRLERELLATLEKTALRVSPDSVVTLREGRYVVSVPERHRALVPGIVHDRSQSGTTYFIEPLAVLDAGNQLRAADADIRDEILSILRGLTADLRRLLPALRVNLRVIGQLDVVWTKSRWAARLGGRIPERSPHPELRLISARHPLLLDQELAKPAALEEAQARVVPFSLTLGPEGRTLVISGPNTGGKTVCLKTLGLTVLLMQAGVPATVAADSRVGHFDAVFADIGDDQSLALSLSTFSAHLKHVGEACRRATCRSLVLLDELGVGTDPEEGGALAQSVLEALMDRDATVVVTTHHPSLKFLSRDDGRVMHAAFTFHEAHLAPTYELVIGRPGRSYALEVAGRLGFPSAVVAKARGLLSRGSQDLSSLLDRLAAQERELSLSLSRQVEKESKLDELLAYNRQEEERWRSLHSRAESEARDRAASIVNEARREVEHLVKEIRCSQAHPEAVRKVHRELEALTQRTTPKRDPVLPRALLPGDRVTVTDLGSVGEITKISADGRRISVRIGKVTYTVAPDRVLPVESPEAAASAQGTLVSPQPALTEIDVRGLSVEEALFEVDSAVRSALATGVATLCVIHGMGTGVLKRELSVWLRRHARVESFRRGGPGEGSDGVTVVTLKP